MRAQSHPSFCGPASLANALRALGVTRWTEDKLVQYIKSSASQGEDPAKDGIGVAQLQRAAEAAGFRLEGFTFTDPRVAQRVLVQFLVSPDTSPLLLAVDWDASEKTTSHWVTAFGVLGDRVVMADPAHDWVVSVVTWDHLRRRMKTELDPATYYMLRVERAPRKRKAK